MTKKITEQGFYFTFAKENQTTTRKIHECRHETV